MQRNPTCTKMYAIVPDEDQDMFSKSSDVQRKQYLKELSSRKQSSVDGASQAKKSVGPRLKKPSLKARGKFQFAEQEQQVDTDSDDMPELVESSESDFDVEEFPSRQRQARQEKVAAKKAAKLTCQDPTTPASKKARTKLHGKRHPGIRNQEELVLLHPI